MHDGGCYCERLGVRTLPCWESVAELGVDVRLPSPGGAGVLTGCVCYLNGKGG